MRARHFDREFHGWALALVALAAVGACKDEPARSAAAQSTVHRYAVRAEIVRLPEPGRAGTELMVRHEAIDDFADASGRVVGMGSMVMGFPVGPALRLEGLAVGDKVRVHIAQDWARPSIEVERLEKLPPDTELEFRPAKPC